MLTLLWCFKDSPFTQIKILHVFQECAFANKSCYFAEWTMLVYNCLKISVKEKKLLIEWTHYDSTIEYDPSCFTPLFVLNYLIANVMEIIWTNCFLISHILLCFSLTGGTASSAWHIAPIWRCVSVLADHVYFPSAQAIYDCDHIHYLLYKFTLIDFTVIKSSKLGYFQIKLFIYCQIILLVIFLRMQGKLQDAFLTMVVFLLLLGELDYTWDGTSLSTSCSFVEDLYADKVLVWLAIAYLFFC